MLLTEEQRAIRDTARAFAQAEIAPHAAAWERDGGAPRNLYRRMGDVGLMGVCVPPSTEAPAPTSSRTCSRWRRSRPPTAASQT